MKRIATTFATLLNQPSCLERALLILALLVVLVILALIYPPAVAIIVTALAPSTVTIINRAWRRKRRG